MRRDSARGWEFLAFLSVMWLVHFMALGVPPRAWFILVGLFPVVILIGGPLGLATVWTIAGWRRDGRDPRVALGVAAAAMAAAILMTALPPWAPGSHTASNLVAFGAAVVVGGTATGWLTRSTGLAVRAAILAGVASLYLVFGVIYPLSAIYHLGSVIFLASFVVGTSWVILLEGLWVPVATRGLALP